MRSSPFSRGKSRALFPDFPQGGLIDVSEYSDGAGRVKVRARIEKVSGVQKLVISEVPYSTTTSSLIASVEAAVQKGKVSVSKISDYTAITWRSSSPSPAALNRRRSWISSTPTRTARSAISSNMVVIRNERPIEVTVSEYLKEFSLLLKKQIKAELEHEAAQARKSAPLADPGADLHREPRLQEHGKSHDGRGHPEGSLRRHEAFLDAIRARHDG